MFRRLFGLMLLALAGCATRAPVDSGAPQLPPAETRSAPAPLTPPAPAVPASGEALVLPDLGDADNIFFRAGATQFDAREQPKLLAHAERLKADPKRVLMLVGHTDDQGSRSYKLAIAQGRVDAVFQALRRLGVPARQLQRYPVGREKTGAGCTTAECLKAMRRVELVYRE